MQDLSLLREGWEAIKTEETGLLSTLAVQESVLQRLSLERSLLCSHFNVVMGRHCSR